MERYNLTWGGGSRTCPGRYLAEMIVYKLVSTLLREFHLEITMPPEEVFRFYYVAMMTRVKVRFLSRHEE
jgi:cytochrome P450